MWCYIRHGGGCLRSFITKHVPLTGVSVNATTPTKDYPGYNALKYDYCWQTRPTVFRNAFNGKLGQWTRSSDNGNSEALRTASPTVKVNKEQLPD